MIAALTRRIQRNYVEEYASVVYRQGSRIELSLDLHVSQVAAVSFVSAEPFERQAVFEVWLELGKI